jgi:hypothetical protein
VTRTLVARVADPDAAWLALHRSQLEPAAVDLLGPDRLVVRFDGGEAAVAAQVEEARRLIGGEEDGRVWAEVAERAGVAWERQVVDTMLGKARLGGT